MSKKLRNPMFSVVIPVWNRRDIIMRCLNSVLSQEFQDFEVIVVDDASTDGTVEQVRFCRDRRVRVVQLEENRGVCYARMAGTRCAVGRWIVSLDSDWSLLSGALTFLAEMARSAAKDVGVIGGCARTDNGEIWPTRCPPNGSFGLPEYLRWIDSAGVTDYLPCRRREVFDMVSWPTDRRLETQFHLEVVRQWRMEISEKIIAKGFTDAGNRITADRSKGGISRTVTMAPLLADDREEILARFGQELKQYAPRLHWSHLSFAGLYNFLAGRRWRGLRYSLAALVRKPWACHVSLMIPLGLMGPRILSSLLWNPHIRSLAVWLDKLRFTRKEREVMSRQGISCRDDAADLGADKTAA